MTRVVRPIPLTDYRVNLGMTQVEAPVQEAAVSRPIVIAGKQADEFLSFTLGEEMMSSRDKAVVDM